MTEEELEQEIGHIIESYAVSVDVDGRYNPSIYAHRILEVLKSKGYCSPEECKQCQEKQRESERKVDQQGLQEELDYWKHKYQWR